MRFLLCSLIGMTVVSEAAAQSAPSVSNGFDAHGFQLVAYDSDLRDLLTVQRAGRFTQGDAFAGGLFEYASKPLVYISTGGDGTENTDVMLDNVFALNTSFGAALFNFLRLDAAVPLYFSSTGPTGDPQSMSIGDARLAAMVSILRPAEEGGGLGLAVVPYLDLPFGSSEDFLGQSGLDGGLKAAVTYELTKLTFSGDIGAQFNPAIELGNLAGADRLVAGLGAGYLLRDDLALNLEAHFAPPFAKNVAAGSDSPAEALLSVRGKTEGGAHWTVGGATALSGGAGAAVYRVFLGGGFGKHGSAAPIDTDGDGLADNADACPTEAEVVNMYKDSDGCPDALSTLAVKVTLADKAQPGLSLQLASGEDSMVRTTAEEPVTIADLMPGSAWKASVDAPPCMTGEGEITLAEGENALTVELKRTKEGKVRYIVTDEEDHPLSDVTVRYDSETDACVPKIRQKLGDDGKGENDVGAGTHTVRIAHNEFLPVTQEITVEPGSDQTIQVKLATGKAKMKGEAIVILDKVYFETDKDIIKSESFELLNQVASILAAHPEIKKIEVAGHTDNQGNDAYNLDLSDRRSKSVRQYLIDKGIAAERLDAKGYGETKPIDSNNTSKGRANNRRVEFNITERTEE